MENQIKDLVTEQEISKLTAEENRHDARPMMDMVRDQWIPDTEKAIPEIVDKDIRNGFEMELAAIKNDFTALESMDFSDEEILAKVKSIYDRAFELSGKVELCLDEKMAA